MPFLSRIKTWIITAGAFLVAIFYARYQKQRADTLEGVKETLEEEIKVQEGISLAKEEVLTESVRRRSEVLKELQHAKEEMESTPYPDGKLDPSFIELLNSRSTPNEDR